MNNMNNTKQLNITPIHTMDIVLQKLHSVVKYSFICVVKYYNLRPVRFEICAFEIHKKITENCKSDVAMQNLFPSIKKRQW